MRPAHQALLATLVLSIGAPLVAQMPPPAESVLPPKTYGTTVVSWVDVPAEEFIPIDSAYTYGSSPGRYSINCNGCIFAAPLHLPSGAKIVAVLLQFLDTNVGGHVAASLVECENVINCTYHPVVGVGPADCHPPGEVCSGDAFAGGAGSVFADLSPDDITVDNLAHSYRVFAGTDFASDAPNHTQINGVKVGYVLQVSPPPAMASFNDVPINHPFFQFIEALYRSGITAGCNANPPMYCPDAPLTRGQAAVFLARTVGLQFP